MLDLKAHIRGVPDFPKKGILFYDISTLLAHGEAWRLCVERMEALVRPQGPEVLLAVESRGFLIAAPLAARLGIGLVMLRKKGKLPGPVRAHAYALEYGTDTLEMQEGMITKGQKTVVVDDLLATGGTTAGAVSLAREMGANVLSATCLIELSFLKGREKLDVPVFSLLSYDQ